MTARVYLVPGFFGFTNFGELKYFAHVKEAIERAAGEQGAHVVVERVRTAPTASIATRAATLLDEIARTAAHDDGPIHVVGHSTGGLDARLLVSPSYAIVAGPLRDVVARVRSVLCVSTPHLGAPLAALFESAFGAQALKLLSLSTILVLRTGKLPLGALTLLAGALTRIDEALGARPDTLDQLYELLLQDFDEERRRALAAHFAHVGADTGLLADLSPAGIARFESAAPDRGGVRYGCIVTEAPRPSIASTLAQGLSPYAQASHALFHALWHLSSRGDYSAAAPLTAQWAQHCAIELGASPTSKSNDGIVPTRSQLRGELVRAVAADHLDVIGHFDDPEVEPPHYDWITSGSGFRRHHFDALWRAATSWILR